MLQTDLLNKEQKLNPEISTLGVKNKDVIVNFDGGFLSSDAGILLLREIEDQIGLIRRMAEVIPDSRDARYIKHSIMDMLIQRIAQIACGYEDANDCDTLRNDPIFKILADRYPEIGEALASQPTMSRLENSISKTTLYRLAKVFADIFIESYDYDKEPKVIVLDFDDTDHTVYGNQQLSLFNNYYREYCFMPLHVYEGLSGKLITTILKPGKRCTGKQMLAIVKRLITYLRDAWPNTVIIFRGDSHFAYPQVMDWIDKQKKVHFITGLTSNSVLRKSADIIVKRATHLYEETVDKNVTIKLYHSFYYQAGTWSKLRRVVVKVEVSKKGLNIRFIVTDMDKAKANVLYEKIYCARGNDELYIKDHKLYLKSNRTSCHKFQANQFRLILHSAAYVLIHALKINVLKGTQFANATMETIRLRLFKIGARIRELKTKIKIQLPTDYPLKNIISNTFEMFQILRKI